MRLVIFIFQVWVAKGLRVFRMYISEPRIFTFPVVQQYQGQKEIRTSSLSIILSYRCTTGIKVDILRFDYEFNNGNSIIVFDLPDTKFILDFLSVKLDL